MPLLKPQPRNFNMLQFAPISSPSSSAVYNSLPGLGADLIETWLSAVLDYIIDANLIPDWTDSESASVRVVPGGSLKQSNGHSYGIYTIFNVLALVRQQEPSLEQVNPRSLRIEYARALIKAVSQRGREVAATRRSDRERKRLREEVELVTIDFRLFLPQAQFLARPRPGEYNCYVIARHHAPLSCSNRPHAFGRVGGIRRGDLNQNL